MAQLPLTAKILERNVAMTMRTYPDDYVKKYMFQSAYRPNHSTESALVNLFNDIYLSLSTNNNVVLYLLDIRSMFNTQMALSYICNQILKYLAQNF